MRKKKLVRVSKRRLDALTQEGKGMAGQIKREMSPLFKLTPQILSLRIK